MQLLTKQIKNRSVIGTLKGGPVWLLETHGGLSLIAAIKNGVLTTIGAGPHRAVCQFISEKREPDIIWAENMCKSEADRDMTCPTCRQLDDAEHCLCLYRWGMIEPNVFGI